MWKFITLAAFNINTELQRNLLISLQDASPNLLWIFFSAFTQYPAHSSYIIFVIFVLKTKPSGTCMPTKERGATIS